MRTLNLGILAHVDAGKTSLTERLLFAAGVIDELGSVDDGSTQTDSLALERKRGITIKTAVVSFVVDDVAVNLIDTPGHPDFIAEVERILSVLDGAVLVISAVEGVQAQTRVLMRTLQRLRIPTLIFVNKIDRVGADQDRVLGSIKTLSPDVIAVGKARDPGTPAASLLTYGPGDAAFLADLVDLLARHDDAILGAYVDGGTTMPYERLRNLLAEQTQRALVHPVFLGSARTGAGLDSLTEGIIELLPTVEGDVTGPVSGTVFKVERGVAGEKIAYVRMFSGTVRTRDRLRLRGGLEPKVTSLRVFERGADVHRMSIGAGEIGKLWGLADVQIGDAVGLSRAGSQRHHFAPPTLETVVVPRDPAAKGAVHSALAQLAEQDPLINLRQDDLRRELFLSLYGEVQKEVIQDTLAIEFGLAVSFRETTTICVERPIGTGAAAEQLGKAGNPFLATVGLRVEPAAAGSGVTLRLDVKVESMPLFIFKAAEEFHRVLEDTVAETLRQGLNGWQVTDCAVTLTQSGYVAPLSTSRDFRVLTPLVLMDALKKAGTVTCEPIHRFHVEAPTDTISLLWPALARLKAASQAHASRGSISVLDGEIPAARVHDLQQQLPGLTRGEGVLEFAFDHYQPVMGRPPSRPRSDNNPLNRKEYLLDVARRVGR